MLHITCFSLGAVGASPSSCRYTGWISSSEEACLLWEVDSVVQVSNHTVDLKLEPQKEQSFSVQIMYKSVFKTIQCVYSLNPKGK